MALITFPTREFVMIYFHVITKSRLQLINTWIDTIFVELRAILEDHRKASKANDDLNEARWRSQRIFSRLKISKNRRDCTLFVKNLETCT